MVTARGRYIVHFFCCRPCCRSAIRADTIPSRARSPFSSGGSGGPSPSIGAPWGSGRGAIPNRSSTVTPKSRASWISLSTSGMAPPLSHLEMAWRLTAICSASRSWESPCPRRSSCILLPRSMAVPPLLCCCDPASILPEKRNKSHQPLFSPVVNQWLRRPALPTWACGQAWLLLEVPGPSCTLNWPVFGLCLTVPITA